MSMLKKIPVCFLFGILCLTAINRPAAAIEDTIVAIVNDDIITLNDLRSYLGALYMRLRSQGLTDEQIQEQMVSLQNNALNKLIEEKLIIDAADEKGLTITDKAIDDKMKETQKQYSSEKEFFNALVAEGLTPSELRKKIEDDLKVKYIIKIEVKDKIFVNPQEVTDYYNAHIKEFKEPERVQLESIFIANQSKKEGGPQEKIDAIKQKLSSGADFANLVDTYSDAPSIGTVPEKQLMPEIEQAISNLTEGQTSEPVPVEKGFYIFKLVKRYPPRTVPLEEISDSIYQKVFQEKYKEQLTSWLNSLKQNAYVEIKQ